MNRFYVLQIVGDVEPVLHGPYGTEDERDATARQLRKDDHGDFKDGIYAMDLNFGKLEVNSYSGGFFEREK